MRGEDAGDNPSAWAEIFLQSMERSHSGAGEEGEAEGVKLLWTEQNLHSLLNPWRRRWRIPEWRSASEKGKEKGSSVFVFYFSPSNSILICNTLNSCYQSSVCFAMMAIGRWFPCLDLPSFSVLFYFSVLFSMGSEKASVWVCGSQAKLTHHNCPL